MTLKINFKFREFKKQFKNLNSFYNKIMKNKLRITIKSKIIKQVIIIIKNQITNNKKLFSY